MYDLKNKQLDYNIINALHDQIEMVKGIFNLQIILTFLEHHQASV